MIYSFTIMVYVNHYCKYVYTASTFAAKIDITSCPVLICGKNWFYVVHVSNRDHILLHIVSVLQGLIL